MKINRLSEILLVTIIILTGFGCSGKKSERNPSGDKQPSVAPAPVKIIPGNETQLLLKNLEENGDYVNSQQFPSLIKSSIVYEELGEKNLVIDLRNTKTFSEGHIKGAVNKRMADLPEYFEAGIRPFEFNKIIMVCDDGQLSSYVAALLRLKGYGNVFAMRWGMGGWNKKLADNTWFKGLSSSYESRLDTVVHEMPVAGNMPELQTGLSSGDEIGEFRFNQLFSKEDENILITADEVFADPTKYFVINFERKDKYDSGHIPGAVRYKPDATLGFSDIMATIPFHKPVVIYCGTGHNSAFATAFLRLFGYDARTLKYGNNSFMYNKMNVERKSLSWLPFSEADVNDFPVVK